MTDPKRETLSVPQTTPGRHAALIGVVIVLAVFFAYANALRAPFVFDGADGRWRGYDIFGQPTGLPEPGSLTLLILLASSVGLARIRRRRAAPR